uniref:DUF8040 domain-containing protein n=1 Tax=Ananas comosus var. bracteatus TaxID=296719 RepID=A0A6V7Q5Q4_ANACO|nr:unnamed protein product [Ananas comosus var. bracteatus]
MDAWTFFSLTDIMRDRNLLKDTLYVTIKEQLAMFLHTVGHRPKNRIVKIEFIRSGETISRYFSTILRAICAIKNQFVQQAGPDIHPEIALSPLYFPYFKNCIGLLDGTHIEAKVPVRIAARFRGRKGLTQNVMAAIKPDCRFTYVSASWEGSANDFTILKHALPLPLLFGLRVEIVLSCCVLHNYILTVDPHDPFLNDESSVREDDVNYYSQTRSQREHREESRQWVELRDNIAEEMWQNYSRHTRHSI